ncbi:nucleoside deaminase [Bowmanella dokdonensis]|uniref:Nucleoside deaminase n=1 Tax=Bowmanella dokdonensis TaxID=751969 RepID=A0A939DRY5_9ALTE|nr:nucleoside deaminase [Bowmanella dokdonensis]MBN7826811.1 nucleoside deaminase [Bowmanella dokdonensis]
MSESKQPPSPLRHVKQVEVSLPGWIDEVVDWSRQYQSDEEKMALAIELSRQNVERDSGGPFGTAIFDMDTGQLLGVGVNQVMAANNSTLHGEVMAIMMAEAALESFSLSANDKRCELFTSCEPCAMCMGATLWSGVKRLVCGATGEDARAIGFDEGPVFAESYRYLARAGLDVIKQVKREEARRVLSSYVVRGGKIYNG